jgi:hypothetical protein
MVFSPLGDDSPAAAGVMLLPFLSAQDLLRTHHILRC